MTKLLLPEALADLAGLELSSVPLPKLPITFHFQHAI